jgi:hypothetical protein
MVYTLQNSSSLFLFKSVLRFFMSHKKNSWKKIMIRLLIKYLINRLDKKITAMKKYMNARPKLNNISLD